MRKSFPTKVHCPEFCTRFSEKKKNIHTVKFVFIGTSLGSKGHLVNYARFHDYTIERVLREYNKYLEFWNLFFLTFVYVVTPDVRGG